MNLGAITASAVSGLAMLAGQATAQMDDDAFGDRVRQYLLAHPDVILEVMEVLSAREAASAQAARIATVAPLLFSPEGAIVIGDPQAPLKIVELFDYKCASCKAAHPYLTRFVAQNPDIAILKHQLPILGPQSDRGARAFFAVLDLAGPGKAAALHEALFSADKPVISMAVLREQWERLGLEREEVEDTLWGERVSARIDALKDAALALEAIGTPTFVTPTEVIRGVPDEATLRDIAARLRAATN